MNLDELQRNWDALGRADPLWAIQFVPAKKGNRWDPAEFFGTGERDVAAHEAWLADHGVPLQHGRALDFGCGVGRLTQALASRFDEVEGVDIAPSMIELAMFDDSSFDLVYSLYVLQHVQPEYARAYLREFLRVLRPGGVLVVGLPSHPAVTPRGLLFAAVPNRVLNRYRRRRYGCGGVMELHGLRRAAVVGLLRAAGAEVAAVVEEPALGPDWHAYRYCAVKRPGPTPAHDAGRHEPGQNPHPRGGRDTP
jgi:SAM-dependent methyltransferase